MALTHSVYESVIQSVLCISHVQDHLVRAYWQELTEECIQYDHRRIAQYSHNKTFSWSLLPKREFTILE